LLMFRRERTASTGTGFSLLAYPFLQRAGAPAAP